MTDKEKLNAIRAEVEKYISAAHKAHTNITEGNFAHLLSFIDSLQEVPVSVDLENAAVEAFKQIVDTNKNNFLEIFKAGANWKEEQIEEVLLSEVLPCFMHGGEADEVVAKLDEVLNNK